MRTRRTSVARQRKSTDCLERDSQELKANHTQKKVISARKVPIYPAPIAVAPHRREPTIEDLIADPSLCVWSKWG
jgi:hypothetical protein